MGIKILFSKKTHIFYLLIYSLYNEKNLKFGEVICIVCFYKTRLEAIFTVMEHMISLESIETWSTLDVQFHPKDEMK